MKTEQLRHFVTTVDCKSLNAAAKELFITQSALSQSISSFEKEIGTKLLIRSNRGITPTTTGRIVYNDAKNLLNKIYETENKWKAMVSNSQNSNGEIRIVTIPSATNMLIDYVIPEITTTFPHAIVSTFEESASIDEAQLMAKYNASMCIGSCQFHLFEIHRHHLEKAGYKIQILCKADPSHLVVSSKHPLAKRDYVSDAELASYPIAFYATDKPPQYLKYFDMSKSIKLQQRDMIIRYVANSNAVSIFPHKITETEPYIKNKQLVSIPILTNNYEAFPTITRYLVHKDFSELSSIEQAAISIINFYFLCND